MGMCNCKNPIIADTKDKPASNFKIEIILKHDNRSLSNQMCSNNNKRLKPNSSISASRSSTINTNTVNILKPSSTTNSNNLSLSPQKDINHNPDNAKYLIQSPSLKRRPIFDKLNQRLHSHNEKWVARIYVYDIW